MASKSDVVIVGAGIVGLTTALALANEGFSVLLVEAKTQNQLKKNSNKKNNEKSNDSPNAAEQPDIRAIALAQSSWERLAGWLGSQGEKKLLASSSHIWDMRIVEAHPLRGVDTRKIHLSHKDLKQKKTRKSGNAEETRKAEMHKAEMHGHNRGNSNGSSPLGSIVEGQVLLEMLYDAATEHKSIEVRHSTQVLDFEAMPAAINIVLQIALQEDAREGSQWQSEAQKTQSQTKIQAKLLLACDGRNSQIRERANISCKKKDYRQSALVCSLAHQRAHGGVAVEWFTPNGTFASLPLLGQRSGIVWCDEHRSIERLIEIDEQEFIKHARVRFGTWLGEIRLASKRVSYPIELSHARKYVGQRLALLGDAAHAIHPLAGQGLNLGLRDVFALVELLKEGRYLGQDIGDGELLARYEKARRYDARKLICVTDGLNRLFSNDSVALRQVRLTGMALIDRLPFVKRAIVSGAAHAR